MRRSAGSTAGSYQSDQAEVAAALERYAPAIADVLGGRVDAAREKLAAEDLQPGGEDRFWISQAGALRAILDGDHPRFDEAMTEVRAAFEAEYADAPPEDPERLLELPSLGLETLGRDQFEPT